MQLIKGKLWLLAPFFLAFFLYLPSIQLLFFWDDIPHFFWFDSVRGGQYWISSAGFSFYRPATFALWGILQTISGSYNSIVFHGLSIVLHSLNTALVAILAARLVGNRRIGLVAGLIFATFPYSYQAVMFVGSAFHLWATFFILVALWSLTNEKPSWCLIWGCALVGVFSHENGVLIIGALGLLYLFRFARPRSLLPYLPVIVIVGFFLLVRMIVPVSSAGENLLLDGIPRKIAYLVQAIMFPLVRVNQLTQRANIDHLGFYAPVIVVIFVLWLRQRESAIARLGMVSLLWVPLMMLPAVLFLETGYLVAGPRLMYLASVGIAWFWASVLSTPLKSVHWQRALTIFGVIAILAVSLPFIYDRWDEHHRMDRFYREVATEIEKAKVDNVLVVNAPASVGQWKSYFIFGAEGTVYVPNYVSLDKFYALNNLLDDHIKIQSRRADDIRAENSENLSIDVEGFARTDIQGYEAIILFDNWHARLVGLALAPNDTDDNSILIAESVQFREGRLKAIDDQTFQLDLIWQKVHQSDNLMQIFVHLRCGLDIIAQADGPPIGRMYPFELWQEGERWLDRRTITTDIKPTCDNLQAFVGIYNPTSGERYVFGESDGVVIPLEQ